MPGSPDATPVASRSLRRTASSNALCRMSPGTRGTGTAFDVPKIEPHLSTKSLTRRRKLAKSTTNHHGFMAEDYTQINWPLPKMFGNEKYAYSLIDIEDHRYLESCAEMSQRVVRLQYDQQIIDFRWRTTYKKLLDAEKHLATLGQPMPAKGGDALQEKTKALLAKHCDNAKKELLELQQQKDMYEDEIQSIWAECAGIKTGIKKENDLELIRQEMMQRQGISPDVTISETGKKFNARSQSAARTGMTGNLSDLKP